MAAIADKKGYALWVVVAGALAGGAFAACGGDDQPSAGPPPPPVAAGAAPVPGAAPGQGSGKALVLAEHVEDRVSCPVPQKLTDLPLPKPEDKCDPNNAAQACKTKGKPYCLQVPVMNGAYCFACNDRDNIRHAFKDRDFAPDQNRDPFQSFILTPAGAGSGEKPAVVEAAQQICTEKNSYALSYSFQDLKFIGLVTQGTQRKALMTAGTRSSYILSRNNCVGKEKAIVKEVGDGYITFTTQPDPNVPGSKVQEFTINLHTALAFNVDAPPSEDAAIPTSTGANVPLPSTAKTPTPTPTAPVPPGVPPKKLVPIPAPQQQVPVPAPAPVKINP